MILTVCLNPTLQKTLLFSAIKKDAVNRAVSQRWDAAGKGMDVSRVLTQLGCTVLHLTQAGGDLYDMFRRMAEQDGVPLAAVRTDTQIRCCTTLIEHAPDTGCTVTELVEEGDAVPDGTQERVFSLFREYVSRADCEAVVISGSKAKGFSDTLFADMASYALSNKVPVIADYRGADLRHTLAAVKTCEPHAPFIIKPNKEEFCQTFLPDTGAEIIGEDTLCAAAMRAASEHNCTAVITQGAGSVISCDGTAVTQTPVPVLAPHQIANTTGCGDAFAAGLCASLTQARSTQTPRDGWLAAAVAEGIRCAALNAQCIRPGSLH